MNVMIAALVVPVCTICNLINNKYCSRIDLEVSHINHHVMVYFNNNQLVVFLDKVMDFDHLFVPTLSSTPLQSSLNSSHFSSHTVGTHCDMITYRRCLNYVIETWNHHFVD